MKPTTCIIPIAGKGSRLYPLTYEMPKHNTPVGGKETLLLKAIAEAYEAGMKKIILVTNPAETIDAKGKAQKLDFSAPVILNSLTNLIVDTVKDAKKFGDDDVMQRNKNMLLKIAGLKESVIADTSFETIRTALSEKIICTPQITPEGLGHAVYQAKSYLAAGEPFAVILPDDYIDNPQGKSALAQMVADYKSGHSIAAVSVDEQRAKALGVFMGTAENADTAKSVAAKSLVEKPDVPPKNPLAIIGRYILDSSVMEQLDSMISQESRGKGNEFQLTDAIITSIEQGISLNAYKYEGYRYDLGNDAGLKEASVAIILEQAVTNNTPLSPKAAEALEKYVEHFAPECLKITG